MFGCCSCEQSKSAHADSDKQLSSSLDHNSLSADTAGSDVLNMQNSDCPKYFSNSSDSSELSSHSKEYFTIGNRFDPTGISSLLNDAIPDDDDEIVGMVNTSGTLSRNKNYSKTTSKQNGLPNKSFNTYATHKDLNKNSKNISPNGNGSNSVNMNTMNGTNSSRYYGNVGSIRSIAKNQRTSFAFPMRTNLDQDL